MDQRYLFLPLPADYTMSLPARVVMQSTLDCFIAKTKRAKVGSVSSEQELHGENSESACLLISLAAAWSRSCDD